MIVTVITITVSDNVWVTMAGHEKKNGDGPESEITRLDWKEGNGKTFVYCSHKKQHIL